MKIFMPDAVPMLYAVIADKTSGNAAAAVSDLFRSPRKYDASSFISSARTHVDDIIRVPDDVQIMFDDYYRSPVVHKFLEDLQECPDV